LTIAEKEEVFKVFYQLGNRMGINGLPTTLTAWENRRKNHLQQDLERSRYTTDLYKQYRKHLGFIRYFVLRQAQIMVVPDKVKQLLLLRKDSVLTPVLTFYKLSRYLKVEWLIKTLLLPPAYKSAIKALDNQPS